MAGPNLELFKFGVYLFFPLAVMLHFGEPAWYAEHVLPIRDQFWPKEESLYRPPRNAEDLKTAMEEMKAKRLAKRDARLKEQGYEMSKPAAVASTATAPATRAAAGGEASQSKIASLIEDKRSQRLV
ncbi:related to PET100-chaperone that specifically facilitates the assembly of cytochrome c oxidase [Sporisorium reilianum f. sp. reilianum]|uniref:Related to PET100-chaperone that specifically facilitates the assembly of cytochrome c oxidase n=1 Tax=Sporisorium reilianum f. sp. reilianum TaxID=72559 RepID=A0A2N8UDJ3_9BASI|nr:related to PET100-chaperone that specifically facilitates the assembly of cytochrome c oxidase [Sporisorium reilianum f. sp. reilianum]